MSLVRTWTLFLLLTAPALGIEFTTSIPEGRNTRPEYPDAYTDVIRTPSGYGFEVMTIQPQDQFFVGVLLNTDSENWLRMTVIEMSLDGLAQDPWPVTQIEFNPWNTADPLPYLGSAPSELVFPSRPTLALTLAANSHHDDPEASLVVFEFGIEEIPEPLPADFNYDNVIDFGDFLLLSGSYGIEAFGLPVHFRGDANMDGITDFEDFMILSGSFGTVRESSPSIQAIPEPAAWQLVAFLPLLLLMRRRDRDTQKRAFGHPAL